VLLRTVAEAIGFVQALSDDIRVRFRSVEDALFRADETSDPMNVVAARVVLVEVLLQEGWLYGTDG
jgi:hypothetical protein